jgi:hypothetical protein
MEESVNRFNDNLRRDVFREDAELFADDDPKNKSERRTLDTISANTIDRQEAKFQDLQSFEEKIGISLEDRSEVALENDLQLKASADDSELARNVRQQLDLAKTVDEQAKEDKFEAREDLISEPSRYKDNFIEVKKGDKVRLINENPPLNQLIEDAEFKVESTVEDQYSIDRDTIESDKLEDESK